MPAYDEADISGLQDYGFNRSENDNHAAFPDDLVEPWGKLGADDQKLISGPWLDPDGRLNYRGKAGECVRALRAAGWTPWNARRLAPHFPHGLGKLGEKESPKLVDKLWYEQDGAELRAEHERAEAAAKTKTFGRLRILSVDDALNAPPRSYLLDGLIAPKELSVWWGKPKCGKSFLMLRLGYGLSREDGMWDREAVKVPVLYVAAEGEGGMSGRIRALHDTMGPAPDFHMIAQRVDLFDPEADLSDLIAATKALKAGLVVIDTLARTMGAGDESATRDMNVFVSNCDRIREEGEAHVAIIHHGGWEGSHARGSIALIGAADLVVKIEGEQGCARSAVVEYAKEESLSGALGFHLDVFDLPPDAKGRPRSTCIAIEADAPAATQPGKQRLNEEAVTLLREIENSLASGEGGERSPEPGMPTCPTVSRTILQAALIRRGWLQLPDPLPGTPRATPQAGSNGERVPDSEHKRLYKRLTHLKTKGIIGFNRVDVWLARAPVAA